MMVILAPATYASPPLPADCPTYPATRGYTIPLNLNARIAPRPGLPQGGYAQFDLGNVPADGTVCVPAAPELPRDVLRGDTSTDILTERPARRVIVDPPRYTNPP